ncbi:diaminopimelate epimerase [Brevibacillus laterosporus]|uniref:diaminopimelate epimerase n=1 Tax=Brevibacillus laterosporus TaxID=1465 RepID=UPI000EAD99A0|nr:diaminopimelate epimerase [Brevibacillus laterosporus]AYK05409.1 diaminopimelate epimerase [Brevibacillus laterosporus]
MRFTKMHGIGNDYVYVNCFEESLTNVDLPELSRRVSQQHFGIGADGLILIMPSTIADFRMRVFNNDGSEARNCGNGLRCVSKYVFDHGLTKETSFTIETNGGIVTPVVHIGADGKVEKVTVDMGKPRLLRGQIPMAGNPDTKAIGEQVQINGRTLTFTAVSMGNPHVVILTDKISEEEVTTYGPLLEKHALFPERANIEFISVNTPSDITFRVWERGSGVTLACGTGACAALVAAVLEGKAERMATIHLLGGDLQIEWCEADQHVYMTGAAAEVFAGEYFGALPLLDQ